MAKLSTVKIVEIEETEEHETEEHEIEETPEPEDTTDTHTEEAPTREERQEELKGKTLQDLREILLSDYDLPAKGAKPALIRRVLDYEYPREGLPDTQGDTEDTEVALAPAQPTRTSRKAGKNSRTTDRLGTMFAPLGEQQEFNRILYYGREGSAKTTNALHAANHGRVLLINAEGGIKKRALAAQGVNLDNVMVWPSEGEEITFEGLREVYFQVKSDLEDDPNAWYAVIFDSLTDIVQGILDAVSTNRVEKVRNRGVNVDIYDSFFIDRDDYGTTAKMLRSLMRRVRDLPTHLILTALERRDVDEDTAATTYGPAVPPAIMADITGYVDFVLYSRAADESQPVFRAVTKQAGRYRVKDRDGILPRVLVNPTFTRINKYTTGELTEETDEDQNLLQTADPKPTATKTKKTTKK